MSKKHMGSSIDDFLKKEAIFEEAQAEAIKEVGRRQWSAVASRSNWSKANGYIS